MITKIKVNYKKWQVGGALVIFNRKLGSNKFFETLHCIDYQIIIFQYPNVFYFKMHDIVNDSKGKLPL